MAEKTMDEFEQLLEETFSKSYSVADIVEGTVIRKEQDGYLVSVRGAKTEAFLPSKEISSAEGAETIEVGDVKEFYVLKEENDNVIDRFLNEHSNFEKSCFLGRLGEPFGSYKTVMFAGKYDCEGFFISKIRRVK